MMCSTVNCITSKSVILNSITRPRCHCLHRLHPLSLESSCHKPSQRRNESAELAPSYWTVWIIRRVCSVPPHLKGWSRLFCKNTPKFDVILPKSTRSVTPSRTFRLTSFNVGVLLSEVGVFMSTFDVNLRRPRAWSLSQAFCHSRYLQYHTKVEYPRLVVTNFLLRSFGGRNLQKFPP